MSNIYKKINSKKQFNLDEKEIEMIIIQWISSRTTKQVKSLNIKKTRSTGIEASVIVEKQPFFK